MKTVRTLCVVLTVLAALYLPVAPPVLADPLPPPAYTVETPTVPLGGAWNQYKAPFNWQKIVQMLWGDEGKITSYGHPVRVFNDAGEFVGWFTRIQILKYIGRAWSALPPVPYYYCQFKDPNGCYPAGCTQVKPQCGPVKG